MKQYAVEVYYKHPQNLRFSVFKHRYKLIAWIKALWATKFGWNFFVFNVYKQEFNMDFGEFKKEVIDFATKQCPTEWRRGQAVFNYIDQKYNVARSVQFIDNVDCFYNDEAIDQFILFSYKRCCGL